MIEWFGGLQPSVCGAEAGETHPWLARTGLELAVSGAIGSGSAPRTWLELFAQVAFTPRNRP